MKYPPKHHQDSDKEKIIEVIKAYPLATIVSVQDNKPLITHLPLVYHADDKLIGHIDIYNPQTPLMRDDRPVTVMFYGPQCYISPTVYSTTQLPTWNYIRIHLNGTVKAIESRDDLRNSLIAMTEFLEAPEQRYILQPDNKRMEAALDYIKMFEITIDTWEGKFKLSQDKKKADIRNAREELIRQNQRSIRSFLDRVFSQPNPEGP